MDIMAEDRSKPFSYPAPPPIPPTHGPVILDRELPQLPQLPPNGPYGRPSSLLGPVTTPSNAHHHHLPPGNYRVNGIGVGTPSHSFPHHEAPPHSAPPEYRSRLPFPPPKQSTNGEPSAHWIPPTQDPTPVPAPIPQTPIPFAPPGYYQSQAYGMRQRKAARAQQACDQCRTRKAKCDEGRPSCSHCKENNLPCDYKEVPPQKHEKTIQLLLDRMQQMEDRIEERMTQLQSIQVEQGSQLSRILGAEAKTKPDMPDVLRDQETKKESTLFVVDQGKDDGELSIPVEHTTAAHKLLMWPSIKALLYPNEYDEDYVMKLEESRGLIRVYGRGEGDDTGEGAQQRQQQPPSMPNASARSTPNWDEGDPQVRSPSGGTWKAPTPATPATSVKLVEHGIEESGMFTTDSDTVRRLHLSYMDNMHRLHPFLNQSGLEKKIEMFIRVYCSSAGPSSASISFMNNHSSSEDHPQGIKRKHSCDNLSSPVGVVRPNCMFPPRIEQSIENAVILLVLALGSICECRDRPVPGPVTDRIQDYRKEQIPGPSLMNRPILSGSVMSVVEHQRSLPGQAISSREGGADTQYLRNMDVIPGLEYYGYATRILGNLQGGNGLQHVQAALLAGLYASQLAHPFQSHGWIYQAARACQVLVRSRRYQKMVDGPVKDLYDFAYWTCLQLESDILAELDLPASGISRLEGRIALPKGRFTLNLPNEICAPSTMMMFFYSAQVHLRKVLNRVHTDLYKVEKQGQIRSSSAVQEILSMNLQLWRSSLPEVMRWKDYDPPSKDINVARLRAKYYGARYIIHRPLLYHALHIAGRSTSIQSPSAPGMASSRSQQVSPSMTHSQRATGMAQLQIDEGPGPVQSSTIAPVGGWTSYTYRDLPTELRRACKVCIDSAILSTEVFDGIEGRPVVTNIFGTGHAQFGNMLVLSATYMSSLSELVDCNALERLLNRTIRFLWQSQHISPSLRADALILVDVYKKVFSEPPGSFSSV